MQSVVVFLGGVRLSC